MLVSYSASPAPCLALFPRERYLQRVLRWEAVGCVWRQWLAWLEDLCPTRLLISSCYPARSLGWIVRALSSSLRYDANRDNQRKLTANVGSDRNSQSIPEAELAGAQRTLLICMHRWKPPRVRCRRLLTSSSDPRRPQGDLFGRD